MKPILYDADRTSFPAGVDNGLGVLADAMSCKVTQELNGQYELELHYPVEGIHYGEIALRAILRATVGPDGKLQPFRVYRIVPGMNGTAAIYARHIAYDLGGYVVSPFTAADAPSAVAAIKSHAMPTDFPFALTTDKTTVAAMAVTVPSSAWGLLGGQQGSLLDVYGGEYEFDEWAVRLLTRRGADRGASVRYGKNLTDLTQDANCANCYTGAVPYWRGNGTTVTAAPVYAEGDFGYTRLMPLDLSSSFEQQPTQAQLQAAAASYIKQNRLGVPAVSWDVKLALLAQSSGYGDVAFLEQIYLGDAVGVYFHRLGVDAKARVNKIVWDCLLERYDSVALGSVKANIAATIAGQQKEIDAKPSAALVEKISASLTAALLGANGGSVRLLDTNGDGEPDELYIADDPDPAKAKKVWRFNYEGWAASSTGYNGPYTMGATIAGGIQAWMITAAHLIAGTIASEQGNFFINLDGGTIDTSATGATYKNSDYSQADLDRINQINIKAVTPTLADYEKLDVNGDGTISITDTVQIQQIIGGTRTVNFTTRWRLRIDPADGNNLLKIYRVYHNNQTGADTENVVFSVGFGRASANTIGAQYGDISKDLSVGGSVDAGSYKQDGRDITFPESEVIGYVVYCTGGSSNKASCFIPAGQSGSFQCASNDWYCAFSFDGSGGATKTGGSGTVDSVVAINNF
jgi:phage minor structural protein|nr:MAG TPA: tail protein [Caudoviricetes sp.]